jgi:subtilase family serine protease
VRISASTGSRQSCFSIRSRATEDHEPTCVHLEVLMTRTAMCTRLAAIAATGGLMLMGAATASAASSTTTVPQGVNAAALPGSSPFGNTPPNTPETVSFVMNERNKSQLEAQVEHGLHHFVSVGRFASQYGGDPSAIAQLRGYLSKFGITTTEYADRVDVVANGTAGEFDQALSVQQRQYHVPAQRGHHGMRGIPAQTVHGAVGAPRLPSSFGRDVLAVLGLTNYAPFTSNMVHAGVAHHTSASVSPSDCEALAGLPDGCNEPANFASNYGLSPLYADGAAGQGQTVAIVTLAALDPGAPQYFWQNIAQLPSSDRTLTVNNIDGGPGAPSDLSGSGETDLDVEQSGSLAPDANVVVYQAPNTDSGFADGFFSAASSNVADSVSSSWGESETVVAAAVASGEETPAYEAAFDEAFLEFAAQGQSAFVSAGDSAAYDAQDDLGTTNLAVDTPGDSPYITSAGGTTLPWSGPAENPTTGESANATNSAQRIWGWDYLWNWFVNTGQGPLTTAAEANVVGSGGGFSVSYPTPSYQRGVSGTSAFSAVPYLTPTDFGNVGGIVEPQAWNFDATPAVTSGRDSGRAEPDVSADADPFSGYLLYEPSTSPALQGGWGGTSFVAPQFNGSTAVIDSYLGHRVGFWNPAVYAAATGRDSPVTPLDQPGTSNDNIYYTGTPGTVYNPGAGLGYPNLSKLATAVAGR